jgi:hypothetical protein
MMTDLEFEEYRTTRYSEALNYYDKRANRNRICYRILSIYIIVSSIIIAPVLMLDQVLKGCSRIIATIIAPTVAIATGIASHFGFHENWLNYRATWDALRHELYLRNANIQDYGTSTDRNALFVARVETLISSEGEAWLSRHRPKGDVGKAAGKNARFPGVL